MGCRVVMESCMHLEAWQVCQQRFGGVLSDNV